MDTNPFATNPGTSGQAQTPSYLQPQGPTTSMPGNISNMVKAIMAGNAQHQMQQQKMGAAMGAPPVAPPGPPMSLAPPAAGMAPAPPPGAPPPPSPLVDPTAMPGAAGI